MSADCVTVAFLRHGTTDWNLQGRMQGRRDVPLCAAGRDDVAAWRVPAEVAAGATWVSSPLCRAVETAKLITGRTPRVESALIEMDWAAYEGRRLDELASVYGDAFTRNQRRGLDFTPPGGESPRDVVRRVAAWLATLSATPLIGVTHNGVLRALVALATGWDMTAKSPVRLEPASLHRFVWYRSGRLSLVAANVPLATVTTPPSPLPASAATPREAKPA